MNSHEQVINVIDVHNHADFHGYNVEKLLQNMDEHGISITCLLSLETPVSEYDPATKHAFSPFSDTSIPFKRCIEYKNRAPDRFLLGYAPDPRLPDSLERLRAAIDLYDINIYGELRLRMMYDNPDAIRIYRFCGENNLPVLMHFEYGLNVGSYQWPNYWYGGGIDVLERVLALCPETNFIGHAPGFWVHISNDELYKTECYPTTPVIPGGKIDILLEKYQNLYCDISANSGYNALNRDHEYARKFLETWQDRVLFGRDYFDDIHQTLLTNLSLPEVVLEKIFYFNSLHILRNIERRKT